MTIAKQIKKNNYKKKERKKYKTNRKMEKINSN